MWGGNNLIKIIETCFYLKNIFRENLYFYSSIYHLDK